MTSQSHRESSAAGKRFRSGKGSRGGSEKKSRTKKVNEHSLSVFSVCTS